MENSSLIGTAEWQGLISSAYARLHSVLVESGLRYFETEGTIATTGVANYALPADYLSTTRVEYLVNAGSGDRQPLTEIMTQESPAFRASGSGQAFYYELAGSNIFLRPTPPSGQTYYHIYVPQPADLSSAATNTAVDVVTPDGEDFLIWWVAIRALAKEESDTQTAERNAAEAYQRLQEWAVMRSLNTPRRRIVDLAQPQMYDPGDWRWR